MAKLNFQQPLLQSSVSHDPPEIILIRWFGAQVTDEYEWKIQKSSSYLKYKLLHDKCLYCHFLLIELILTE